MKNPQLVPIQRKQVSLPPIPADSAPAVPAKSRNKTVFIVSAVVASLFLCMALCVVVIGTGTIKAALEKDDVGQVIDQFMYAMARKDTDAAYMLFSTRSKRTASLSDLEELLQGNNFALFDGYKSVEITKINLSTAFQTNPDLPQGTVAKASGTTIYESGRSGRFDAVLEQETEEWKLFGIHVTISSKKTGN